jgi:polysaccharide export outer membrane protein
LALPFNLPVVSYQVGSSTTYLGQQRILGYLVTARDSSISDPGKTAGDGLTRLQLTNLIKEKLIEGDYIKDPIVTVQMLNFKISVMGEVSRPGVSRSRATG